MRKRLLAVAVALVAIVVWAVFGPGFYRLDRVHPAIRSLQQPYQSVKSDYYLDGGSVVVGIVDHVGRKLVVTLPCSDYFPRDETCHKEYSHIYIGTINRFSDSLRAGNDPSDPLDADTREMLAQLLRDHAKSAQEYDTLRHFPGTLKDRIRVFCWALWAKIHGQNESDGVTIDLW